MKVTALRHEDVPTVPEQLAEGVLYVCDPHRIAIHRCCCGCGEEVVTPLSPAGWRLDRRGSTVSLYPSIGNWSFRCQSHYWIRRNRVVWAGAFGAEQIALVRARDKAAQAAHIAKMNAAKDMEATESIQPASLARGRVWDRLKAWFGHR